MKKKVVLINDTTYDNHYGCDSVVRTIKHLVKKYNGTITSSVPFYINWENSRTIKRKIKKSDIVIVNGEGSLHSSNMRWLVTIAQFAKNHNSHVHLVNSIYQDNPVEYKKYLELFDSISVRESLSMKELKKVGVQSNVVPDFSFYVHQKPYRSKNTNNIYFSDSTVQTASQELSLLKSQAEELRIRYHCFFRLGRGISIMENIKSNALMNFKNLVWLKHEKRLFFRNEKKFIKKINNSKLIITGRFHLICLAIKHQKSFVPYKTNTFKIEGLLNDVFGICKIPEKIDVKNASIALKEYTFSDKELMSKYTSEANQKIDELFQKILMRDTSTHNRIKST